MRLRDPLDDVFDRATNVKILRILSSPGLELTGREVAAEAGINHAGCTRALKRLAEIGIVEMRKTGRAYLYTLRRQSLLVDQGIVPLFKAERSLFAEAVGFLRSKFAHRVVSAALFGSYAREEESHDSDLDVLFLVESEEDAVAIANEVLGLATDYYARYGLAVNPYVKTVDAARRMVKTGEPPLPGILKEGADLFGRPFREVLLRGAHKVRRT